MHKRDDDKVARLAQVWLFRACSPKQLTEIASLVDEADLRPGAVLCREGDPATEAFLVDSGLAEVTVGGQHLAVIGPGETIGEMGLLDHQRRSATVVATTDMHVYVVDARRFQALIDGVPTLARAVLCELAARLRAADENVLEPAITH